MALLKRNSGSPLYLQLARVLKNLLESGRYDVGDDFLSEAQIEEEYGVSRITVRNALKIVESDGYIHRDPGKPTVVARVTPIAPMGHRLGHLSEELREMGLPAYSDYDSFGIIDVPRDALKHFDIETELSRAFSFRHLLYVDGRPISIAQNLLLDDPNQFDLTRDELMQGDFYELLARGYGIDITNGIQAIGAVSADEKLAKDFGVSPGSPVLRTETVAYTKNGSPKLFVVLYLDAGRFRFRQRILR